MGLTWTAGEEAFLRTHRDLTYAQIGEQIGRTGQAVRMRAQKLDLKRASPKRWTASEDQFITEHPELPYREIGIALGRNLATISKRADFLGARRQDRLAGTIQQRMDHYTVRGSPDECWAWTGGHIRKGYGIVWIGEGEQDKAHRVAWELINGPVPEGMQVLHRCDNPGCVNPAHLFLGTNRDNINDKVSKRRHRRNFSDEEARAIRVDCARGETREQVAQRYGVNSSSISEIVLRKTYSYVV